MLTLTELQVVLNILIDTDRVINVEFNRVIALLPVQVLEFPCAR